MSRFDIGKDDLAPSIRGTCKQAGVAFDLTDCTVEFVMAVDLEDADPKVRAAAIIVEDAEADPPITPVDGVVQYDWIDGDTDTEGDYLGEFEVTLPNNKPITFPNKQDKKIPIRVNGTLGD